MWSGSSSQQGLASDRGACSADFQHLSPPISLLPHRIKHTPRWCRQSREKAQTQSSALWAGTCIEQASRKCHAEQALQTCRLFSGLLSPTRKAMPVPTHGSGLALRHRPGGGRPAEPVAWAFLLLNRGMVQQKTQHAGGNWERGNLLTPSRCCPLSWREGVLFPVSLHSLCIMDLGRNKFVREAMVDFNTVACKNKALGHGVGALWGGGPPHPHPQGLFSSFQMEHISAPVSVSLPRVLESSF